jgi:hypothetical protein
MGLLATRTAVLAPLETTRPPELAADRATRPAALLRLRVTPAFFALPEVFDTLRAFDAVRDLVAVRIAVVLRALVGLRFEVALDALRAMTCRCSVTFRPSIRHSYRPPGRNVSVPHPYPPLAFVIPKGQTEGRLHVAPADTRDQPPPREPVALVR